MTDYTELKSRLRNGIDFDDSKEAADAIESLQRKIAEKDTEIRKLIAAVADHVTVRSEQFAKLAEYEQGKRDTVPEGWVMVPVEPTEAMLGAISWELVNYCRKEQIYKAAIAAAPAMPKSDMKQEK